MKCMDAMDALLDADLSDAADRLHTGLQQHLRVCERCQRVAATLRSETAALGALVSTVPQPTAGARPVFAARPARLAALAGAALVVVVAWPAWQYLSPTAPIEGRAQVREVAASTDARVRQGSPPLSPQPSSDPGEASPKPLAVAGPFTGPSRSRTGSVERTRLQQQTAPSTAELGTPIPLPGRITAVPLSAVEIVLHDTRAADDAALPKRTPVLLEQSKANITVYWVF